MKVVINYQEYADVEVEKAVLGELAGVEVVESRTVSADEFIDEVGDADAVIVQYAPCGREVIEAMARCRVIVRYGVGVDNIDLAAARDKGIPVCNVPGYCLDEVANHALAMMLALHRRLPAADRMLRQDAHDLEKIRPIPRLSDTVAGLVGFGRIARRLAEKIKPLFKEVLAHDPLVDPNEIASLGARSAELPALFSASDFISIHLPLTDSTRGLISRDLIARMKPSAFIINTSRGAVVDEAALVEALHEGRIAGAGLDVFAVEPLPSDSPLRAMDNVILTGHYGWYSEGAILELKETAAREALRVLKGEAPLYEVKT